MKDETKLDVAATSAGVDPIAAAEAARLRYVNDWQTGFSRKQIGKKFVYFDAHGNRLRDGADLKRIAALVIPPAWTDVWICATANGHLQATGRDARGRKQYRYHTRWRDVRDETKYERMIAFAQALPAIRASVQKDLDLPGLPRAKVLALVVKLLESTHIRVGNEEYARSNKSFGLATLRNRHVKVSGRNIRFQFRGKSRVEHAIDLQDKRLARIIKRCQDLPGYELFQYVDDEGASVAIEAGDVNEYLREIAGAEFSTKDFRTWAGTLMAAQALRRCADCESQAQIKRNIVQAVESVARILGNTKAVCRKCYIHPAIIEAYSSGLLSRRLRPRRLDGSARPHRLKPDEAALVALLNQRTRVGGNGKPAPKKNLSVKLKRLSKMFVARALSPSAHNDQRVARS